MRYLSWAPALLLMGVIFILSSNPDPPVPHIGNDLLDLSFRKGGHFAEYTILAILFYFPLRTHRRAFLLAFLLTTLYAMTDEWHQTFIPTRNGNPIDWLIDSSGAFVGILIAAYYTRFIKIKGTRINTD